MINNDFHPTDRGLNATEDHWGTEKEVDDGTKRPLRSSIAAESDWTVKMEGDSLSPYGKKNYK